MNAIHMSTFNPQPFLDTHIIWSHKSVSDSLIYFFTQTLWPLGGGGVRDHISVDLLLFDVRHVKSADGRVSDVDLSCWRGYFGLFCELVHRVPFSLTPTSLLAAIFGGQAAKLRRQPIVFVRFLIIIPLSSSAIGVYGSP